MSDNISANDATPLWHSRGYLPHVDGSSLVQHVTFHLADSLPADVLERMDLEISLLPVEQQDLERRKRIDEWIDAGHGCCVLKQPAIAEMVQNALLFFDAQRYRLLAWIVMPNHVHALVQPMGDWTLSKIVSSWKSFTGRRISTFLRERGEPALRVGPHNEIRVWHREYWDRYIRGARHLAKILEYIHQNPVKAGLTKEASDWSWSSANPGIARLQPGPSSEDTEPH